jgi:hypothetical protein
LIKTDEQRRWWFATHPEYSHKSEKTHLANKLKVSPREVDKYVDNRLEFETNPVMAEMLKAMKRWSGTAGQNRESYKELNLKWPGDASHDSRGTSGRIMLAGPVITPEDYIRDVSRMGIGGGKLSLSPTRPALGGGGSPPQGFKPPFGGAGGPGEWVEVRRGLYGLEHQSRMSGLPIRQSGGKYHIYEYRVGKVYFDDYRDGILYEYKGNYSNFIGKKTMEFYHWSRGAKGAQSQALRQLDAAQGVPLIWRVGPNQMNAFDKAVGRMPGLSIEP